MGTGRRHVSDRPVRQSLGARPASCSVRGRRSAEPPARCFFARARAFRLYLLRRRFIGWGSSVEGPAMKTLHRRYKARPVGVRATEDVEDREEIASRLITPDVLLPDQLPKRRPTCGDARLMLAVLEEAVSTFRRNIAGETRREQRLLLETEEWFRSNDNAWPFAFESICNTLGFDPDYLRSGFKQWK